MEKKGIQKNIMHRFQLTRKPDIICPVSMYSKTVQRFRDLL